MYRRNITHILGPLALILCLFVLYHAWLKPNYFPDPPPPAQKVIPEEAPPPQPPIQAAEEATSWRNKTAPHDRSGDHAGSKAFGSPHRDP